jgi:glutaredoxin-like protein
MSSLDQYDKIMKNEMSKLKNNISIKIFTDYKTQEDNSKLRTCMACDSTVNLLEKLVDFSDGKFEVEEISTTENPELAEKYKVKKIPTILFLDKKDKEVIRYSAVPTGPELAPFLKTLQYFSGMSSYYKDQIVANMKSISKSEVKLFMSLTCPYCPATIPVLNQFAILSKGKINAEIIDVDMNPDIAMAYKVAGVPHTVINETDHIYGMFTAQEFLEKLTKGKQDFGGMYA